ncbi:hypothetical protein [Daejeonella sp. H1SJ63]|jgi:hypothetical protein|uniref:hypothetical protein n=1 Tax=Daejeonella sp. H1SJ63 TaxID=3034145 RepID=UPI0023EB7820|nr:hypothetical protein [Daejeonella sp. H1SJ63]
MKFIKLFSGLFFASVLISCSSDEPQKAVFSTPKEAKIMEPFRFHKAIEVKPGLTLDVLSWGRGTDSIGGYLILRSDSTHYSYRSVTGELKGKIVDSWGMDLDTDGNPELFIQAVSAENKGDLNMYVYEYNESGTGQQIRFPELSSSTKEGYLGADSLYIKDGKLMREFQFSAKDDTAKTPAKIIRKLEYSLRNNSFQVKEIKEEDQEKKK